MLISVFDNVVKDRIIQDFVLARTCFALFVGVQRVEFKTNIVVQSSLINDQLIFCISIRKQMHFWADYGFKTLPYI